MEIRQKRGVGALTALIQQSEHQKEEFGCLGLTEILEKIVPLD